MGVTGYPATSVRNYHCKLPTVAKEGKYEDPSSEITRIIMTELQNHTMLSPNIMYITKQNI
jgi:hypothetical protein